MLKVSISVGAPALQSVPPPQLGKRPV
jgi:hypothetical protein